MAGPEEERSLAERQLDQGRLREITESLIKTITSPEVMARMSSFRSQNNEQPSFEDAANLLSLESLREAGAALPEDFRITSRVFEDLSNGTKVTISPLDQTSPTGGDGVVVAWGACAGGGAATVCGCAGGSTAA